MLLTNEAGTPGSTAAISRRTALAAASGAPAVSTTQYMLFASQMVVGSGTCEIGMYTSIVVSFEPEVLHVADDPDHLDRARHLLPVVQRAACARRSGSCRASTAAPTFR